MIMGGTPYMSSLVAGSRMPQLNHMKRISCRVPVRRRGLGNGGCMSGQDFTAAIQPMSNCDPRDVGCVLCNQQTSAAVSNLVDSGCVSPGTPISFSCDTSPAALSAFRNNTPIAVNATVGTGSNAYVATGPTVSMATPGNPAAPFWGGAGSAVGGNPPGFINLQPTGAPPGGVSQQTIATPTTPPYIPLPPPPPAPQIVNPSPNTLLTLTGSSFISPNSALSQANGSTLNSTAQGGVSTVGGWFSNPVEDVIPNLPNWAMLALAGAGLFIVVTMAQRR
jgi:hypothetical protein